MGSGNPTEGSPTINTVKSHEGRQGRPRLNLPDAKPAFNLRIKRQHLSGNGLTPDYAMSVLARAGDVEAEDAEADGHQTSAGKVFPVLVQAQHENDPRDNPSITKKAGAPGRDRDHGEGKLWLLSNS